VRSILVVPTLVAVLLSASPLSAGNQQATAGEPAPPHQVPRAAAAVHIDGVLDDAAWASALTLELRYEVQPGENIPAPVRTECLVTYDTHNLYVAFRAFDPEPARIRAHVTDRDAAYRNDYVGIIIDTANDQRRAFEFFVNPLGVQMDLTRNDVGSGDSEDEDDSWDAIWSSAGRMTTDGYVTEMAIPFSVLRFPYSDNDQTWGFTAFRAYPRTDRHQIALSPLDRNRNCFLCQFPKIRGFAGVRPGRDIELDPTVTSQRTQALADEGDPTSGLGDAQTDTEAGISGRWGVTPNVSLNAALNPDFSQVEADVAQLSINRRFSLFYPEKRPFFMESADIFQTPFQVVHTRTIADPAWGVKLSGKPGRQAVGAFVARDTVTSLLLPGNQGSALASLDDSSNDGVVRFRRDVGESSTVGFLATGRDAGDYRNGTVGLDGVLRLTAKDVIKAQAVTSSTRYPAAIVSEYDQPEGTFAGAAYSFVYSHETRDWATWAVYEDVGRDFRADLGFMPRVDTQEAQAGAELIYWGDKGDWYNRINVGVEGERITDHSGLLTDQDVALSLHYEGPLQSFLNAEVARAKEYLDGVTYDLDRVEMFGNIRPTGDFTCSLGVQYGDQLDYENSRKGRGLMLEPGITYNIGRHVYVQLDGVHEELSIDAGRVYRADLVQGRFVYQFTVRSFVRLILQYLDLSRNPELWVDEVAASEQHLLTQLLFSYKINPQTVLFVGYSDNHFGDSAIDLATTDRTVFVKVGYAWLL
jgi:hypothetical protein